jgi:hypothetical protein
MDISSLMYSLDPRQSSVCFRYEVCIPERYIVVIYMQIIRIK